MPEPTAPESEPNRTSSDPVAPATSHRPGHDKMIPLLMQLTQDPAVPYAAIWSCEEPIGEQPQTYAGQSPNRISLAQRKKCVGQVAQKPNQPFLLGDQSGNTGGQSALVCLIAAFPANLVNATVQRSYVFEIQFRNDTSMAVATASLQTAARTIQQSNWKLWANQRTSNSPEKSIAASPQKPSFEFSGQAAPSGFSAAGLTQGIPTTSSPTQNPAGQNQQNTLPAFDLKQFQSLTRQVHKSLDPHETDLNVCNELAAFLDCDRVSVVRKRRGKFHIDAISGQTSINKRSKIVQQLQELSAATLKLNKGFHAPSDQTLPSEIQSPLDSYLLTSDVRSLVIIPVMSEAKELQAEQADLRDTNADNTVIAGIIIESLKKEIDFQRHPEVQTACDIGSDAIRASHQHRQLFLYPLWHWLGHTKAVALSRRLPLSIIAGLIVTAVALLAFWPATFYVSSEGTLVPETRNRIFSPLNGIVEEVYVKPHQAVTAGQPLIRMRDFELESQLQKVKRELAVTQSQIEVQEFGLRSDEKSERFLNDQDITPLPVLKKERENLIHQLELLEEQKKLMLVSSKIDGTVMTWRVDEELLRRPVPFGRLMMEIAQINGRWKVVLNLPDRRIGHLLKAMDDSAEPLKVEFVLAARPEQRYYGTLSEVALTTAASQEDGSFVKIEVDVDSEDLQVLQNETEVSAKILCGKAALGYVWLHDISEFAQKKIFFFTW